MRQQVNLYHPMFKRQRRVLSGAALFQSLAAALTGLALLYAYSAWQVQGLRSEVAAATLQRDAARERLVRAEQRMPRRRASKVLGAELARVGAEVSIRRELIAALSEDVSGEGNGFSGFFEGLSRQRVDGLWLTGLQISGGGRQLAISGSALRPELVPRLVQRLSAEPKFAGVRFTTLNIDRSADDAQRVDFVLRTARDEAPAQ